MPGVRTDKAGGYNASVETGQVDYFLKLDGIEGESNDHKHKNEIEILSWSWGASQGGTMSRGGGGGAGKVSMQDFHFVSTLNKASPKLFLSCATGTHIPKAVLTCRKAGGDQVEYFKVTLSDLLVSSYQTGGSNGDVVPTEQVSLNFSKIEISYAPQDAKGGVGSAIMAGYDLSTNKKV